MIAVLATFEFTTRVVCEAGATDEEVCELAQYGIELKVRQELREHLIEICEDTEIPYGELDGEDL